MIMNTKLALLAFTVSALAFGTARAEIQISSPQSYETAAGMQVGVALMTFENTGTEADKLVSASSPVCDHIEIHEMSEENGVMKMRAVEGGLDIPAGGKLELSSHSYHLMLMGLKEPLKSGSTIGVDVGFASGEKHHVDIPVSSRMEKMEHMGHDMGNMEHHD